jgi:nucleotide-binding universal stress UspA family protein
MISPFPDEGVPKREMEARAMIPPIKKILYATDLGKNSIYAFYYAVDMAKKYGAEICILHVIEPIPESTYGSGTEKLYRDQHEASVAVIQNRIRKFCSHVEEEKNLACVALVAKILVTVGNPAREILKAAEQEGCQVIVLGDHAKGFLSQAFLGSVSRSVMDDAKKPVFLIPLPSDETSVWGEM